MTRKRHTDKQLIAALKDLQADVSVQDLCQMHGVRLPFIQPGKLVQNAFIERFNGTFWISA